ncbi:MAG: hypothetical protein ABSD29_17235 [Verrucomicrobiota bacterium]|jgi:hypothetical protein
MKLIVAVSLASGFLVAAQEPDASAQNNATAAEVISQLSDLVQATGSPQPEDMAPPNDLTPTNGLPQASSLPQANALPQAGVPAPSGDRTARVNRFDNSSRSQNDDRRSRGRRSFRSRSNQPGGSGSANDYSRGSDGAQTNALAGTNTGPASLDYAAFKIIVDGNIFDPNRTSRRAPRVRSAPRSFDALTLVGTMSYEKGTFAFFDGTSSEYKKALKLADAIAGYKLTNIAPNSVKLASGTNELELSVGAQLRREEDGPWLLSSQSTSYAATPASTSTNAAATTTTTTSDAALLGAESDIIKKLMEKREKE